MSGTTLDKFKHLFQGLDRAYGQLRDGKDHSTTKEAPTDSVWESHLKGEVGLGIIPVMDDGLVFFGVIDIDVMDITQEELAKRVLKLGLPLYVCKSKGKGYHCYFFYLRPGKQASLIRRRLRMWATALGYPNAECFPKQDSLQGDQIGNWINLPYFGGYTSSNRFCMTPEGKQLTLTEFLDYVEPWNPDISLPLPAVIGNFDDAPPCLATLMSQGVPAGQRNNGMYNIGVFLKKAYPEAWREQMRNIKSPPLDKPIPDKELNTIIKSLSQKDYFYKCEEDPIASVCNRPVCLTKKFGIGHGNVPHVGGGFTHPDYQSLEKLATNPPRYYLTVNGLRLDLDTDSLMSWNRLRKCLFETLDEMPASSRRVEQEWERTLAGLIKNVQIHDVPPEASESGQVLLQLEEWAGQCSEDATSLIRGDPYWEQGHTYISLSSFEQLLANSRNRFSKSFKTEEIVSLMKFNGWLDCQLIKERKTFRLWMKRADRPINTIIENMKIVDVLHGT